MKTFVIVLLFVAIGCYAGDTSDITSKVFEKTNKDGTVSFRMVTTYRGKAKVLMETFRPNAQGVLVISSRSYLAGGDLVTMESDEHKSGRFDTVAVYRPGTDDMEVFIRQADGSVKPVSTQTLQAYKKQNAAVSDFIGTMWTNTNTSDEEISERIQAAQKKIQDAEKQKTDGKQ
jgi:outer membrane lipoprotein-sorting protein